MASLIKRVSSALNSAITAWKDSTSSDIALLPTASYSQGNIQVFGSEVAWHDFNSSTNIEKALDECPPISYILYKKALAFGNGKLTATNLKGEEIKDLSKLKNYNLLKNPNFMQTDLQFRISIKITIEAYGYCPVLQIKGKFGEILSMWILPPRYVKFYKSGKLFYQLKYVDIFDK